MLPWDSWAHDVAHATTQYPNLKTLSRLEEKAWTHVLAAWGAAVSTPNDRSPMQLLRQDLPTREAASAWWTVLAAHGWSPEVLSLIRLCRAEYLETLGKGHPEAEALRRTETRWDRACTALYPGAYPSTVAETLRRMERRLEEVASLRAHAVQLLRDSVLPNTTPERQAKQVYALDELEFERELRWLADVRASVETATEPPEGAAYTYVDPVRLPDPAPQADPFGFTGTTTPVNEGSPARAASSSARDPFDFDSSLSTPKS